MSKPFTLSNGVHSHNALSVALEKIGSNFFLSVIPVRPTTVTIVNVSTAGAGWTQVVAGLVGVLTWRLSEKSGQKFDYCYDNGAGGTSVRCYGVLQRDTDLSTIYVKRTGAIDLDMELEYWV